MSIDSQLQVEQRPIPACGINPDAVDPHVDLAKLRHCFKARTIRSVVDDSDLLPAP